MSKLWSLMQWTVMTAAAVAVFTLSVVSYLNVIFFFLHLLPWMVNNYVIYQGFSAQNKYIVINVLLM